MDKILLYTVIIVVIIFVLIGLCYNEELEEQDYTEELEDREEAYLTIQNMTSNEVLLFKDKKQFIDTIKQYDTIKYFLKGTEEENTNKLLEWYYPGYKKL